MDVGTCGSFAVSRGAGLLRLLGTGDDDTDELVAAAAAPRFHVLLESAVQAIEEITAPFVEHRDARNIVLGGAATTARVADMYRLYGVANVT